ncbi:CPXCG motif-containing cysteine-rich protein [Pseudoalteromonas espejiana]
MSCPYCGESIEVLLDAADIDEQYIEDCQVCCKPISFVVFEDDDELKVNVYSEDDTF